MLRLTGGSRRALGISSPCFLHSDNYSLFALWLHVGDFWIFLSHFFGVFWWLRFGLLLRGRGSFDTLPYASPFSSDTGIPAHVGRLCLPPRWRLRHMLQEFRIIIKISSMLSDSWAGLCQQAHVKDCLTYLALPVPLLRQVYKTVLPCTREREFWELRGLFLELSRSN